MRRQTWLHAARADRPDISNQHSADKVGQHHTWRTDIRSASAIQRGGLSDVIISLYAGGMMVRDICHHLQRVYGTEISPDTVSVVTDAVLDEVRAWQTRPLDAVYPIVYIDALVVKVRDGNQVRNKAAHLMVGVDLAASGKAFLARAKYQTVWTSTPLNCSSERSALPLRLSACACAVTRFAGVGFCS